MPSSVPRNLTPARAGASKIEDIVIGQIDLHVYLLLLLRAPASPCANGLLACESTITR